MFELKSSPIFNLSMASKELFHSNMLYWISMAYRPQFTFILETMGVQTQDWPSNWKSHREKDNFDLSITNEKEDEYLFILENKVKSIPYTEQLEKYQNKAKTTNAQWMLLSLATNLPNEDNIKEEWKIKNYQDLAFAISMVFPTINDNYHRQLLEDYCACILSLHKMQSSWTYKEDDKYLSIFVDDSEEEKNLGIEDIRKKVLYSRLAAHLQKELKAMIYTNKQIRDEKERSKDIYINSGMTRATGLLDIKIRIRGNLLFVIQIQGNAYRHCIETLEIKGEELDTLKSIGLTLENKSTGNIVDNTLKNIVENFFSISEDKQNLCKYLFDLGEVEVPKSKKKSDKESSSAYNKYGNTFIYQYVKIKPDTTVKDVVNAIIEDVEAVKDKINNEK